MNDHHDDAQRQRRENLATCGVFESGREWVLWRPGLADLRRRALRSVLPEVIWGLVGAAILTGWGMAADGPMRWQLALLGAALAAVALAGARIEYQCWGHQISTWPTQRVDRGRGDLYYRITDLAHEGLPTPSLCLARDALAMIRTIQEPPLVAWLRRDETEALHRAAWHIFERLAHAGIECRTLSSVAHAAQTYDTINSELNTLVAALRRIVDDVARLQTDLANSDTAQAGEAVMTRMAAARELLHLDDLPDARQGRFHPKVVAGEGPNRENFPRDQAGHPTLSPCD